MAVNEKPITLEELEKDYSNYSKAMQWRLIENKIIKDNDIKVAGDEAKEEAKMFIRGEYQRYGQVPTDEDLEKISDQVRKASALMRDTIWTISDEKISIVQFGIKVKEFAERSFQQKKVMVHFKNSDKDFSLRPETTLNLFRIVQEVINNASKHSGAKNFFIENCIHDLEIKLSDDGAGFDPEKVERGYGLNNIANRAKDINAHLNYPSGNGTTIVIQLDRNSIYENA